MGKFDAKEVPEGAQVLSLKLTMKVRLEAKDPHRVIARDDDVINIYNKIEAQSRLRMKGKC